MNHSSRTRSSKSSPTHSRGKFLTAVLLTFSAAIALGAADVERLAIVATRDQKVVRRWSVAGDPRGVAVGPDGTIYVGLAQPQAVIAVDPASGAIRKKLVLDSAEIASTKELVTLRTNRDGSRLYIANGSDESVTILSLPGLGILREITIEGEAIRDAVPDPRGRYLYLLGRRVHVYDIDGKNELHTLPIEEPMAIAAGENALAVIASEDYGNTKATSVTLYETNKFKEVDRDPLQTTDRIESALFSPEERSLVAISRDHLFEKPFATGSPKAKTMSSDSRGQMRVTLGFGDFVNADRVCLPEQSGAEVLAAGPGDLIVFPERRCSSSGIALTGSPRRITPASLYGVSAYAIAYDRMSNALVATDKDGFLTIYRMPRPAIAK